MRLTLGGMPVIDEWRPVAGERQGRVELSAGAWYALQVDYFNAGGVGALQLGWTRPGGQRQLIPSRAFQPAP